MKIILFLFFVSSLWANEECITSQIEISSDIADLALSKCDTLTKLDPCSACVPPLLKSKLENLPKPTLEEVQQESLKVAIDEYKKVAIRNIVDLAKARTLPNSSHNFKRSLQACKAQEAPTCPNSARNPDKKLFKELFDDLNKKIGSEIANIVSKKPLKKYDSLLTRVENACFIPEQTVMQVSASTIAEVLDADLISILEKIDITKYPDLNDLFDDYENEAILNKLGDNATDIIRYAKNNPYLKDIFSSPKNLSDFIKSIPSPKTSDAIKNQIYSKNFGKNLDEEIAGRCEQSFKALTQFVCSDEFANGEINIDPKKNFDHLIGKQRNTLHSETPVDLFLEQKNKALMFCHYQGKNKNAGLDLDNVRKNISNSLNDSNKIKGSLSVFNDATYREEFQETTDLLCKEIQTDNCTDMTNMRCRLVANYKKTLVKDSPEYRMANSSNDDVNAVLRGMIADPARLDPEVREVLVKEGILPDSKGNIAETGNIPERQPMVMGQASGITQAKVAATSSASSGAKSNSPVRERPSFERTANFALPSRAPANAVANSFPPLPDFSDVYEKSDELKRFEEEIQRRLMGLDEPSKPKTVEEAKKVIRDAAKAMPSRPIFRPNVETKMAERLLESQNAGPLPKSAQDVEQEKRAQAIQDEKWEKELQNRAVSNMAGVRAALEKNGLLEAGAKGSPLAQANGQKKDLTKVALNIPEDPKVNLTEVFGKKFNGNDPETEVLKVLLNSKNDFLLKINELDFKVIFDENKQFKVLLQEGNKEEAFRIRPQLEIFLKRLSQKNSASKLSVDISRN